MSGAEVCGKREAAQQGGSGENNFFAAEFLGSEQRAEQRLPGETPGGAGLDAQMQLKMSRQFSSQPAPAAEQDAAPQSLMSTDFPEDKDDGFLDMLRNPAIREALQPQQSQPQPIQPEAAPQDSYDTKMDEGIHWGAFQGNESLLQPKIVKNEVPEGEAPFEETLQKAQIADGSISQEEAPFEDELLRQPAAPNSEAPAANPLINIPISLAPVGGAPKAGAESKPKYGLGDRLQMWYHRHTGRGALPEIQEGTPAEQYMSKKELFDSQYNARQAMDPESEMSRRHKESLGKKDERMISPSDQELERRRKRTEEFSSRRVRSNTAWEIASKCGTTGTRAGELCRILRRARRPSAICRRRSSRSCTRRCWIRWRTFRSRPICKRPELS
jgi:hypothetical protein